MSNHLHVVLRILPKRAQTWTVREVVRRWLMIWPKERGVDGRPVEPRPEVMDDLVANTAQVEIWRERLADLYVWVSAVSWSGSWAPGLAGA